jgi:hypothetical protein
MSKKYCHLPTTGHYIQGVIKVINVVKISGLPHSFHWHERTAHRAELDLDPKVSKSLSEQNGSHGFLKCLFEKKLCLAQLKNYVAEISGLPHHFHWHERIAHPAKFRLRPKLCKSLSEQNGRPGFLKCLFEKKLGLAQFKNCVAEISGLPHYFHWHERTAHPANFRLCPKVSKSLSEQNSRRGILKCLFDNKLCLAQLKNCVAEISGSPHPFHWHERTTHPAKFRLCPKLSKSLSEQSRSRRFLKCLFQEKLSQIYGDVPSRFFFEILKGCYFPTCGRGQAPKFFL